jgi:hypothetical protein
LSITTASTVPASFLYNHFGKNGVGSPSAEDVATYQGLPSFLEEL